MIIVVTNAWHFNCYFNNNNSIYEIDDMPQGEKIISDVLNTKINPNLIAFFRKWIIKWENLY